MSGRMDEEILRDVLLEAVAREYGEIMDTEEDIPVSRRYRKEMYAMCEDPMRWARRKSRPLWKKCVRIAAMIFLVITILLTLVLTVSPKARAAMTTWVEDWYHQFVEYRFRDKESKDEIEIMKRYEIGDIKDGYWLTNTENKTPNCMQIIYQNPERQCVKFKYITLHNGLVSWVESNNMRVTDVTINGCEGRLFLAKSEYQASIISWINEEARIQFFIDGYVSAEDLLSMAKSVQLVNSTK